MHMTIQGNILVEKPGLLFNQKWVGKPNTIIIVKP